MAMRPDYAMRPAVDDFSLHEDCVGVNGTVDAFGCMTNQQACQGHQETFFMDICVILIFGLLFFFFFFFSFFSFGYIEGGLVYIDSKRLAKGTWGIRYGD